MSSLDDVYFYLESSSLFESSETPFLRQNMVDLTLISASKIQDHFSIRFASVNSLKFGDVYFLKTHENKT